LKTIDAWRSMVITMPAGRLQTLTHATTYGRTSGAVRRLRNQAQLCTRTFPLALAVYVLLMLVGRVQSVSLVNFLMQAEAACQPRVATPASEMLCSEHNDSDEESYTNEWDEDDQFHSPLPLLEAAYPDACHRLSVHGPGFAFSSLGSRSCSCRGPPRA